MDKITQLKAQIYDLNSRRKAWKWSPDNPLQPLTDQIFDVLDQLCDLYPQATQEQREEIRRVIAENLTIRGYLEGYLTGGIQGLKSAKDVRWLELGLIAASISDLGGDYRDWIVLLGDLFLSERHAGIEPMPYFKAIGTISNPKGHNDASSTQNLLKNFDQTAYFAQSIIPELDKLQRKDTE